MFEKPQEKKESKMSKSKGVIAAAAAVSILGGASAEAGKADMFEELDRYGDKNKQIEKAPANPPLYKEKSNEKEEMFSDMDALENLQKKYVMANESESNDIRKEIANILIAGGKTEQFLKEKKAINLKSGNFHVIAQLVGDTVVGTIKDVHGGISDFRFSLK